MTAIEKANLPEVALLQRYSPGPETAESYTDCYATTVVSSCTLAEFVFAFYTTPLFKLERIILKFLAKLPSTDADAQNLANGAVTAFAAWTVEDRTDEQLLMCDLRGRTRSWFMVAPDVANAGVGTRLYFGSAVVPVRSKASGEAEIGRIFRWLLGLHRVYSILLLKAARRRLAKTQT